MVDAFGSVIGGVIDVELDLDNTTFSLSVSSHDSNSSIWKFSIPDSTSLHYACSSEMQIQAHLQSAGPESTEPTIISARGAVRNLSQTG